MEESTFHFLRSHFGKITNLNAVQHFLRKCYSRFLQINALILYFCRNDSYDLLRIYFPYSVPRGKRDGFAEHSSSSDRRYWQEIVYRADNRSSLYPSLGTKSTRGYPRDTPQNSNCNKLYSRHVPAVRVSVVCAVPNGTFIALAPRSLHLAEFRHPQFIAPLRLSYFFFGEGGERAA